MAWSPSRTCLISTSTLSHATRETASASPSPIPTSIRRAGQSSKPSRPQSEPRALSGALRNRHLDGVQHRVHRARLTGGAGGPRGGGYERLAARRRLKRGQGDAAGRGGGRVHDRRQDGRIVRADVAPVGHAGPGVEHDLELLSELDGDRRVVLGHDRVEAEPGGWAGLDRKGTAPFAGTGTVTASPEYDSGQCADQRRFDHEYATRMVRAG